MNILLGCLLLVMQATAALAPHQIAEESACTCCSCGSQACATPRTSTAPAPSPVAAQQTPAETEKLTARAKPTAAPIWCQNDFPALPNAGDLHLPAGRPLYERFCALLI
jgi:hypothetical protein